MQASKGARGNSFLHNENVVGYIFAAPFIISFLCLTMVPMGLSLYYSFCNYKIGQVPDWIGLKNFMDLLRDATFGHSLLVTIQYVVIGVPLKLVFALFVAMLLTKPTRMQGFYRAVYYIPSLIGGSVAVALVWKQLFGSRGPVVGLIKSLGATGFNFFGSTTWAFVPLVLCNAWQFGSSMIIFLAGLKGIPRDLYEAAAIDGAGRVKSFFHVTLPQLSSVIFFNLVYGIIGAFQQFNSAFLITKGGPANSTYLYALMLYQKAFQSYDMGYASGMAWILLVIIAGITGILFATSKFWVYYDN